MSISSYSTVVKLHLMTGMCDEIGHNGHKTKTSPLPGGIPFQMARWSNLACIGEPNNDQNSIGHQKLLVRRNSLYHRQGDYPNSNDACTRRTIPTCSPYQCIPMRRLSCLGHSLYRIVDGPWDSVPPLVCAFWSDMKVIRNYALRDFEGLRTSMRQIDICRCIPNTDTGITDF